jgi:hypothetical protein
MNTHNGPNIFEKIEQWLWNLSIYQKVAYILVGVILLAVILHSLSPKYNYILTFGEHTQKAESYVIKKDRIIYQYNGKQGIIIGDVSIKSI